MAHVWLQSWFDTQLNTNVVTVELTHSCQFIASRDEQHVLNSLLVATTGQINDLLNKEQLAVLRKEKVIFGNCARKLIEFIMKSFMLIKSSKVDGRYARWLESCVFVASTGFIGAPDESFPRDFWDDDTERYTSYVQKIRGVIGYWLVQSLNHQSCLAYLNDITGKPMSYSQSLARKMVAQLVNQWSQSWGFMINLHYLTHRGDVQYKGVSVPEVIYSFKVCFVACANAFFFL